MFSENLFQYLYEDREIVIIDESHRDISLPLKLAYTFPSNIGTEVKISIILLAICVFIVAFTSIPRDLLKRFRRLIIHSEEISEEKSLDKIVDEVMGKHPSWRRNKLRDIMLRLR